MEFLIDRHAQYSSGEQLKPDALGDELFSDTWTREAVDDVVKKGATHLTQVKYYSTPVLNLLPYTPQSYRLWDAQRDWELEILETAPESERHAF